MITRTMRRFNLLISLMIAIFIVSCSTSPTGRPQLILKSDAELEAQLPPMGYVKKDGRWTHRSKL